MKLNILMLCAALGMTACMNEWDTEIVSLEKTGLTAQNIGEPNTTIAKVRDDFQSQITSGAAGESAKVTDDLIFEGVVVGNDMSGNIYQTIYVQSLNEDGSLDNENGGIQIAIKDLGSLATYFAVGQKIRMNLKGLYVSGYGKMIKVGMPYVTANQTSPSVRVGPMPRSFVASNIQLIGKPNAAIVTPHEFSSADMNNIDKVTPLYVVIRNCTIAEANEADKVLYAPQAPGEYSVSRTVKMSDGKTVTLYNSTSADFASNVIPEGQLTLYGIMTRYNNYWQLILRSKDDVVVQK